MSNVRFDVTTSEDEDGTTMHVLVKQPKIKVIQTSADDTATLEDDMVIVMDSDNKTAVMYSETDKWGFYLPFEDGELPADDWASADTLLDYNPVIVGYETVDGKPCTIIEYTIDEDGEIFTVKMWLWTQYAFPVKEETTAYGQTTTTLYTNITFNTVTDADFVIPSDIEWIDFSDFLS